MSEEMIVRPQSGASVHRQEFGAIEQTRAVETASSAVAEQAKAAVQARYIMALQRPRDWDEVRTRLLRDCRRPSFAAVARYRKPVGQGVEGPSIRFAEAALRAMTNVLPETLVVFDDGDKRVIRVQVTDLEANLTYTKDIVIAKVVERRNPKGMTVLGQRTNSRGDAVYICEATEDDLLNKQAAQESKALRSLALRLVPGDILDEWMEIVKRTQRDADAKDPDAARKQVASAFDSFNVSAGDLKAYLGHDLGKATPAELEELRAVWSAVRDGEATWQDALDFKLAERGEEPTRKKETKGVKGLKERLRARQDADLDEVPDLSPEAAQ